MELPCGVADIYPTVAVGFLGVSPLFCGYETKRFPYFYVAFPHCFRVIHRILNQWVPYLYEASPRCYRVVWPMFNQPLL